jgi:hypothetical protein
MSAGSGALLHSLALLPRPTSSIWPCPLLLGLLLLRSRLSLLLPLSLLLRPLLPLCWG